MWVLLDNKQNLHQAKRVVKCKISHKSHIIMRPLTRIMSTWLMRFSHLEFRFLFVNSGQDAKFFPRNYYTLEMFSCISWKILSQPLVTAAPRQRCKIKAITDLDYNTYILHYKMHDKLGSKLNFRCKFIENSVTFSP